MSFDFCAWLGAHWATLAIDVALTVLLFYPLAWFIRYDWHARRGEFCRSLHPRAQQSYLTIFQKQTDLDEEDAPAAFEKFYDDWFGRRKFILPLAFLFLAVVIENFFLAQALQKLIGSDLKPKDFQVGAAAIAGAYTFVCWDMFQRMQRRILSAEDVLRTTLRLVVAVPTGFAFGSVLAESVAPFVAFAIGAFPLATLNVILQRTIKKRLELEAGDPKAARDQVFLLSGIDTAIAERLEDADISTITQLAWADPIDLTIRTSLQFPFVIDIISQALAWTYLEDKLKSMGLVGLRGAIEIRIWLRDMEILEDAGLAGGRVILQTHRVVERADEVEITDEVVDINPPAEIDEERDERDDRADAEAALKAAAKIANVDEAALRYALLQIGEDPTARLLDLCWQSLTKGR